MVNQQIPTISSFSLLRDDKTFCLLQKNKEEELCVNVILCLAKFFIHRNKEHKCPPNFTYFNNNFRLCVNSLKLMKSPKVHKLYSLLADVSHNSTS